MNEPRPPEGFTRCPAQPEKLPFVFDNGLIALIGGFCEHATPDGWRA